MKHFLTRLVERARGTAQLVEPIIAPRFAPALIAEIATEEEAASLARPGARSPVGIEAPPARREELDSGTIASPNPTIVRQEKVAAAKPEVESPERSIASIRESLLVPLEIAAAESPSLVRRTERGKLSPLVRSRGVREKSSSLSQAKRPGSSIPATTDSPLLSREWTRRLPDEPAVEPPIVKVTIGRIEVRAAPAPASPSRKTASSSGPKLTLDTYLKSRKAGAR